MTSIIYQGDVREQLRQMPNESLHCIITSSPYYGLRAYGTDPQVWGGNPTCQHEWGEVHPPGYRSSDTKPGPMQHEGNKNREQLRSDVCTKCGAWKGELGMEPTPEMFVQHITEICRELKRVLRSDGTFWYNIGDSFARDKCKGGSGTPTGRNGRGENYCGAGIPDDLKPKDMIGIPWMIAFALRADGWYLRADLPWIKRNSMPSSVTDRPASSIEHVFLFAKSQKYYYDHIAVMQHSSESYDKDKRPRGVIQQKVNENTKYDRNDPQYRKQDNVGNNTYTGFNDRWENPGTGLRFMRDSDIFFRTWQGLLQNEEGEPVALVINPRPFKGAHFACFPVQLVEPMILAGTSEAGVCPICGAPCKRITEKGEFRNQLWGGEHVKAQEGVGGVDETSCFKSGGTRDVLTTGWQPTCSCNAGFTIPATVLDPFSGSAATGVACQWHNRDFIGIELNPEYTKIGEQRLKDNK